MFRLRQSTTVYIACPPKVTSGGPELLHQLCFQLQKNGIDAKMFYVDKKGNLYPDESAPELYARYQTVSATAIDDRADNLLIVPELLPQLLKEFKEIQKCVWWLGINHFLLCTELFPLPYVRVAYNYLKKITGAQKMFTFGEMRKARIHHLAQCWYAVSFLHHKQLHNVAYLSDYINDDFAKNLPLVDSKDRENIVLYNPKRNMKYVKKLQKAAPDIRFVPIEKMTREEVIALMCRAKIYIDFGSHPGKDRMPREAALCHCCVFTSLLGSADFYDDVPLTDAYKFQRKTKNVELVVQRLRDALVQYETETHAFDSYRAHIMQEKNVFEADVKRLFKSC